MKLTYDVHICIKMALPFPCRCRVSVVVSETGMWLKPLVVIVGIWNVCMRKLPTGISPVPRVASTFVWRLHIKTLGILGQMQKVPALSACFV